MSRFARLLGLSVALVALTAVVAAAQEAVPLAFKFTRGDVLEYDVTMSGSGGLRAPDGQLSPVGLQGSLRLSLTVLDVLPDGSARLGAMMPRVNFQMTVAKDQARMSFENGQLRWFANGKEQAPPQQDITQAPLLGVPLEFVASPKGQILDVVLPDLQGVPGLPQLPPGLSMPQMKDFGDPILPDVPVRIGETWRRVTQLTPVGPALPITITSSRTLDSYSDTGGMALAKISGFTEARARMNPIPLSSGEQSLTVGLPEMRKTVTSTEFFNPIEGKLVRADYDVAFNLRVSVGTGGQSQEASIEARIRTSVQAR